MERQWATITADADLPPNTMGELIDSGRQIKKYIKHGNVAELDQYPPVFQDLALRCQVLLNTSPGIIFLAMVEDWPMTQIAATIFSHTKPTPVSNSI